MPAKTHRSKHIGAAAPAGYISFCSLLLHKIPGAGDALQLITKVRLIQESFITIFIYIEQIIRKFKKYVICLSYMHGILQ
ncbi:hypothetical protein BIV59_16985 [Bacillus sp. MUM 13]|nr:hypothetical protein BIV59_16985 [Bacillus sp. MUM 13]